MSRYASYPRPVTTTSADPAGALTRKVPESRRRTRSGISAGRADARAFVWISVRPESPGAMRISMPPLSRVASAGSGDAAGRKVRANSPASGVHFGRSSIVALREQPRVRARSTSGPKAIRVTVAKVADYRPSSLASESNKARREPSEDWSCEFDHITVAGPRRSTKNDAARPARVNVDSGFGVTLRTLANWSQS